MRCGADIPKEQSSQSQELQMAKQASSPATKNEFAKQLSADAPVLKVSTDATYPPFSFHDDKGNIIGLDADIIYAIAADQNMNVLIRHQPWEKVFTGITSAENKDQIVVSAMAFEEGNDIALKRSNTYLISPNIILVKDDSPIQSIQDLNGKHIAVPAETVSVDQLKTLGIKPEQITENTGTFVGFKALANGKVDAIIDDKVVLSYHAAQHPERKFRVIPFVNKPESESLVMAVAKDNDELLQKINTGLANIRANGTYDKILAKWHLDKEAVTPKTDTP